MAVAINDQKQPLFTPDERLAMLRQAITIDAVRVAPMDGLLVEFAASEGAHAVVRGLRAISDFEFEFQMALMNRKLDPEIETIFLHAEGGIHLSQLANCERNRQARGRCFRVCAVTGG